MLTQGYTQQIVDTVHRSIVQDITVLNKKATQPAAPGLESSPTLACRKESYRGRALVSIGIEEMDEQVALSALG